MVARTHCSKELEDESLMSCEGDDVRGEAVRGDDVGGEAVRGEGVAWSVKIIVDCGRFFTGR